MTKVWRSKATIGWNLHLLTQHDSLEHFVIYSSFASVVGAPGQANHAAANAFLDSLADWRLALGLPVNCVNWGPWSDIGEAARRFVESRRDLRGIEMIGLEEGTIVLRNLLGYTNQHLTVTPLNIGQMQPSLQKRQLFEFQTHSQLDTTPTISFRDQLNAISHLIACSGHQNELPRLWPKFLESRTLLRFRLTPRLSI